MGTHHGSGFHHSEAELQRWKREDCLQRPGEEHTECHCRLKPVTHSEADWDKQFCLSSVNKYNVLLKNCWWKQECQRKIQCMIMTLLHAVKDSWTSENGYYRKEKNNARVFHSHFVSGRSGWSVFALTLMDAHIFPVFLACDCVVLHKMISQGLH